MPITTSGFQSTPAALAALASTPDERDAVVGDDDDREPFHGLLQAQLHAAAAVHRLEDLLVLLLARDIHPRAQQRARPRHARREVADAARRAAAGGHGRREAAVQELLDRREPRDAHLAQFREAAHDERVVGLCRLEAEARGALQVLHASPPGA